MNDKIVKMVPFHCARPKGAWKKCAQLGEEGEKYCLITFQYSAEIIAILSKVRQNLFFNM